MSTSVDYIEYVCDQIREIGKIRYKKMFGEYMVYVFDKPVLLVCDNTVFVKMLDCVKDSIDTNSTGFPYNGAKEHYILDIDNTELSIKIIELLLPVTAIPKPKKKPMKVIK